MIQEKPANSFDTRILIKDPDTLFTCPAWARFTDGSDFVETIQIRPQPLSSPLTGHPTLSGTNPAPSQPRPSTAR